ncbi:GNAT family N-acetyltransferase [Pseudomonas sp. L5B5]|uniref:GNAT family N-acetyltransferase n=1 Tax=Pseudomonas sp. L5B5 TaxID=2883205 RepID=UPI000730784F|nr:GNAT family N-acetyltransferase [Pseudomonas sp. L5B5]KTC40361.1 GNAT family acetyltransferase [Pseudomonas sp. ABAC61]UCZ85347.1 GNAT family N-acetyltransferase [Pseudomonas sp. L5B5]
MTINIRRARVPDAAFLPPIERSAAALFRSDRQLAWLADAPVTEAACHERHIQAHPAWVAMAEDACLCGFLTARVFGTQLHVLEVSVASDCQGRGIGKGLLRAAVEHARQQGLDALTLSTFRQLPWNEPFYQRQGFVTLQASELSPRLRQVLADEAEHGLPAQRRCAMHLLL